MDVEDLPRLAVAPKEERPDLVFIALHGPDGEDGTVQGFLEVVGIPYTGSGVLASALAMDKVRCKAMLSTENIILPPDVVFERWDKDRLRRSGREVQETLDYPVVVKPSRQGSTYGCTIAQNPEGLADALREASALTIRFWWSRKSRRGNHRRRFRQPRTRCASHCGNCRGGRLL
jgi:D-alanine-D-alanine ligase